MTKLQGSDAGQRRLIEDHGLVPVKENPVLDVPAHGAGEDDFFQVPAFLQEIVERIAMRDAYYVLLNDGTVVQDFGDIWWRR